MDNISLTYHGNVRIEKYKKGKLQKVRNLKNAGTSRLFYILCNALIGNWDRTWAPTYLDLIYFNSDGGTVLTPTSILNNLPVLEISPPVGGDQNTTASCYVTYQTTLTNTYVRSENIPEGAPLYFALRDNTSPENQLLAWVKTGDGTDGSAWSRGWTIAVDEVYIITWQLEIGNDSQESETTPSGAPSSEAEAAVVTPLKTKRTRKVTKDA